MFYLTTKDGKCQKWKMANFEGHKKTSHVPGDDHQLKCTENDHASFNVYHVCAYQLNENMLWPCAQGEHLQNCRQFECSMMYKCPQFYCIPWSYICDGKWDCPGGADEGKHHSCRGQRSCKLMLRCRESQICVHVGNICDHKKDCPLGDDVHLCSVKHVQCPNLCDCLTMVTKCFRLKISSQHFSPMLQFYSVWMKNITFVRGVLDVHFPLATLFSMTNTNLRKIGRLSTTFEITRRSPVASTSRENRYFDVHASRRRRDVQRFQTSCLICLICRLTRGMTNLVILDASSNNVSKIIQTCFSSATRLSAIRLNNNFISIVEYAAFKTLQSLSFLDLSDNLLSSFSESLDVNVLVLDNNPLADITVDSFLAMKSDFIKTTKYQICCLAHTKSACVSDKPWFVTCDNLLSSGPVKVCFCVTLFLVALLNISNLVIQKVSLVMLKETVGAATVTVISIGVIDLVCGLYMTILITADISLSDNFLVKEQIWRSSFSCFAVFCLTFSFNVLSPTFLFFLCLSRLVVVVCPFAVVFKQRSFVFKCSLSLASSIICISLLLTTVSKVVYGKLPVKLCSPFLDPTNSVPIIKILTWVLISLHLSACTSIPFTYAWLSHHLFVRQKSMQEARSQRRSNKFMMIQFTIQISSNLLCWIPGTVVYLLALSGQYDIQLILWSYTAILSVNSLVNPTVFAATVARKLWKEQFKIETQLQVVHQE